MTDFEKIISFESLYKAHRRARLSKRHKKEVVEFELNLSENLWKLHYDLKYGTYEMGGYHSFMIYDPKEREIQAISYRDRVVQHSICDNYLIPLLEKKLIYDNVACRKNKGSSLAYKRLRGFLTDYYKKNGNSGYFVKLDIKKYFPSINHTVLKEKLAQTVSDEKVLNLLFYIIDSYNFEENAGLPMGNQSSQCFALLYLDEIDKFIKRHLKVGYFVRYMDDFILLTQKKEDAKNYLKQVSEKILSLKINLNHKSQIIAVKNGIEFLGWRFDLKTNGKVVQRLRASTKKRILYKVKTLKHMVFVKRKNKNKIEASFISYNGITSSGMAKSFYGKIKDIYYRAG